MDGGGRDVRLPRATAVKNRAAAPVQITAEQLLRESKALQQDEFKPPAVKIADPEELAEYRLAKRKEFEDLVRRVGRWNPSVWAKYAAWEEAQADYRRARSVWERALEVDARNVSTWMRYVEMEMRGRFVNHARNLWDRATALLPRVDQLWYKYAHMEEMLGNVPGARGVYERWAAWEPDHHGWAAYVKMELRYGEVARARAVYERYVRCLPSSRAWVAYAKFEMKAGDGVAAARAVYERAVEELGPDGADEALFLAFAEFEAMVGEPERARAIYRAALDALPRAAAPALYEKFAAFERRGGDRAGVEAVVAAERRFAYEAAVAAAPLSYDAWFDYARLEEAAHADAARAAGLLPGGGAAASAAEDEEVAAAAARVREVYERAVAAVPPAPEKRYWRRYIYLWIKYALFEELDARAPDRAREVYRACLKLLPHRAFTFAKVWVLAAQLEVRAGRLPAARKILGTAIGVAPKDKLFRAYIDMEAALGEVDRCRQLYAKYVEWRPAAAAAWGRFAELEAALGEAERARALYELAVGQPALDAPEALWKAYLDFEAGARERGRARALYERLLRRTQHVKVWLSYAAFEAAPLPVGGADGDEPDEAAAAAAAAADAGDPDEAAPARAVRARAVYERGFRALRESQPDAKEEAALLLDAWRAFEADAGAAHGGDAAAAAAAVAAVERRMPRRVKRKRALGDGGGFAEYFDYVFPGEAAAAPALKILEAAYRWKRAREGGDGEGGEGGEAGGAAGGEAGGAAGGEAPA